MNFSTLILPVVLIICVALLLHFLLRKNLSLSDPLVVFLLAMTGTFVLHQFSGLYTIPYVTPFGWFLYLVFSIVSILFVYLGSHFGKKRNLSGRVLATSNGKILRVLVYGLIAISIIAIATLLARNLGTLLSAGFNVIRMETIDTYSSGGIDGYIVRFAYFMFLAVPLITFNPHIFTKKERIILLSVILILGFGRTILTAGRWPLFITILVLMGSSITNYNIRKIRIVWVSLAIILAAVVMVVLGQLRSRSVAESYAFEAFGYHPWMKPLIDYSPATASAYFQSVSYFTQGIVHLSMYLDDADPNRRGYLTTRFIQLQMGTMSHYLYLRELEKLNMPIFYDNPKNYSVVWATGYRLFVHDYGYIGGALVTALLSFLTGYCYHNNKYRRDVTNLMALAILYPTFVMMPIAATLLHPNFLFLMNCYLLIYLPFKLLSMTSLRLAPIRKV